MDKDKDIIEKVEVEEASAAVADVAADVVLPGLDPAKKADQPRNNFREKTEMTGSQGGNQGQSRNLTRRSSKSGELLEWLREDDASASALRSLPETRRARLEWEPERPETHRLQSRRH